jgi:hypothetical protein
MLLLEVFVEVRCFEFGKSSQWSFFNLGSVIKFLPFHCWLEFCYLWWLSEGTMGLFEFFFSWRSWHTLTWFCFCSWFCRWGTDLFTVHCTLRSCIRMLCHDSNGIPMSLAKLWTVMHLFSWTNSLIAVTFSLVLHFTFELGMSPSVWVLLTVSC